MALAFDSFEALKHALATLEPESTLPAVIMTPALAEEILSHDPVNRKLRAGNLSKIKRDIVAGFWDVHKAPPIRFLPDGRLADGQHRLRAVIESKLPIVTAICTVSDTIGVDEGAPRTLGDHLALSYGLDEQHALLASNVTKALCHVAAACNRDYLNFYKEHEAFVKECAAKPLEWLADQQPAVAVVFKPTMLATLRARAIHENKEPAESVDQFFLDAINGGMTAPEGSPRRQLARQWFDAMQDQFKGKKKQKQTEILKWVTAALKLEREGQIKNILTARIPKQEKRRRRGKTAPPPALTPMTPPADLHA